jgi:hypothetical protein
MHLIGEDRMGSTAAAVDTHVSPDAFADSFRNPIVKCIIDRLNQIVEDTGKVRESCLKKKW